MEIEKKPFSQIKAGATLSYFSMGLGYVIALAYTPIMLRLLGQSEYGLYNLAASVVSYLGLLHFGFGSTYVRFYSRYKVENEKDNIAKLNGMVLLFYLAIGLIAILAGTIIVLNVEFILGDKLSGSEMDRSRILMAIMVFNIALSFPASIFNSYIIANEKYIFQKLVQMINLILNPLIILPVLFMGYGSVGMVVVITVLNLFVNIANAVFCFRKLKIEFLFHQFDLVLMREMIVFSSFVFIGTVIDQINWNVDKFILGRFHGTIPVAVYGLGANLNRYYLSLSYSIWSLFTPRVNRMVAANDSDEELTNLFIRIGRVQFIILSLVLSGFIFFGRPFINMWAGTEYNETYYITLLLIGPVTIPLIQTIGLAIQQAKNLHRFRSLVYLFIAVANVFISIPLARMYGGVGSALGTAISLIIGNGLIINWYYHKKVGLDIKQFWIHILKFVPSFVPPILIGIIINIYVDLYSVMLFLLCSAFYVAVFGLSLWLLGMNQYEKKLIGEPVLKIIKRFGFNKA